MEKMEHHNSHQEEKNKLFNGQQPMLEEIYKNGFSDYVQKIKELEKAFVSGDKCVCCIDEGTPGGVHSAGTGILRDKEEVLRAFREAGVTEITSHDGCGAAGLYAKAHNLDLTKADEYGKSWSQELARELGVPYRHITSSEMSRPKEFHVARVAYYDGTGEFNYSKLKELPAGFIISRAIQSKEISAAEANVSLGIATGDHGFGNLVSERNPFVFVAIGKDQGQLDELIKELEELKKSMGDRVKIDGFVAPSQEK